jgi:hypothetical protein
VDKFEVLDADDLMKEEELSEEIYKLFDEWERTVKWDKRSLIIIMVLLGIIIFLLITTLVLYFK